MYIPALGRFLSVDPVQGGTPSNYVYPTDAVNENDISGQCPTCIILLVVLGALAVATTSRDYWKDNSTSNLVNAGISIAPVGGLGKAGSSVFANSRTVSAISLAVKSASPFSGKEFAIGKNVRVKPLGNWKAKTLKEKLPHYHRRIIDKKTGKTKPRGGIGKHRPWEGF